MNIEELRKAYEAATPGEWEHNGDGMVYGDPDEECESYLVCDVVGDPEPAVNEQDYNNAEFIALAHNAFPVLLKAVELCELMSRMKTDEELEGGMSGDDAISTLGGLIESARDIVEELE